MNKPIDMILHGARRRDLFEGPIILLDDPDGVVKHPWMSKAEKRALLASWASDAYAVDNRPTLRRLDNGRIVPVEEILRALKALDEEQGATGDPPTRKALWPRALGRRRTPLLNAWRRGRRTSDDNDDDPPPCPASIRPRRPDAGRGGTHAVADRELAVA